MRTTVIVEKRGEGYVYDLLGQSGGESRGVRCGLTPFAAAVKAARLMIDCANTNAAGGVLMAPTEVLELVPRHLRTIHPGEQS